MTSNDILRRLRNALSLNDAEVIRLAGLGGMKVYKADLFTDEGEDDDDASYVLGPPGVLGAFLDGLVLDRRGPPKPGTTPPPPPKELTTNGVLKRIRVALMLRDDDIIGMLEAAGQPMSKGEVSALFRRPDHRSFRPCGHQVLRKFLRGLGANPPKKRG